MNITKIISNYSDGKLISMEYIINDKVVAIKDDFDEQGNLVHRYHFMYGDTYYDNSL